MKKIQLFVVTVLLITILSNSLSAATNEKIYTYSSGNKEIIVDLTDINEVQAERIARSILDPDSDEPQPINLVCSLFGHSMSYSTVKEITHYYYTSSPHCKLDTYNVGACDRCDYTESTLKSTARASCH